MEAERGRVRGGVLVGPSPGVGQCLVSAGEIIATKSKLQFTQVICWPPLPDLQIFSDELQ